MKKYINRAFYNHMPGYFLFIIISLMMLNGVTSVSAAEYIYVSDHLRVGVRAEPVSGMPPIGVVFTGMRLELHERADGYVRITTDKGISGWVKDIYVTKKAPAIIQLNAFQVKHDKLKKERLQESEEINVLEKANTLLSEQVDNFKARQREWSLERADLIASQHEDKFWFWIVVILVLIALSFAAGVFWNKLQVTKRLGGLKV